MLLLGEGRVLQRWSYFSCALISLNNVCVSLSFYFEIFLSIWVFCLLIGLYHMCVVHKETRNRYWVRWNWSYRWLWPAMWMLGLNEPRPSGRPVSALNLEPSLQPTYAYVVSCSSFLWMEEIFLEEGRGLIRLRKFTKLTRFKKLRKTQESQGPSQVVKAVMTAEQRSLFIRTLQVRCIFPGSPAKSPWVFGWNGFLCTPVSNPMW